MKKYSITGVFFKRTFFFPLSKVPYSDGYYGNELSGSIDSENDLLRWRSGAFLTKQEAKGNISKRGGEREVLSV